MFPASEAAYCTTLMDASMCGKRNKSLAPRRVMSSGLERSARLGVCPSSTFTVASSFFPEESGWEAHMLADSLTYLCSQVHISPFPEFPKPSAVRFVNTKLPPCALQYGQEFLQHDQHWGVCTCPCIIFLPVNILILLSCTPPFVFRTNSSSRRKSVYNMSCQM